MSDMLLALEESTEERAGIMSDSGCYTADAVKSDIERGLVNTLIRWRETGATEKTRDGIRDKADLFFEAYAKHHGEEEADRIRSLCRDAWIRRKAA